MTAVARVRVAAALAAPLIGLAGLSTAVSAATPAASPSTPVGAVHRSCAQPAPGRFGCLSKWRAAAAVQRGVAAVGPPAEGYGPADIASAYRLDTTRGEGQTIAIVDAYDNPNVERDLAVYRAAWGLPPCTTANGCFRKVNQRGGKTPPVGDPGWGVEIALDVQAVSAACPKCKILLVEADEATFEDVGAAVNRAVRMGAAVVSNSYGADEFTGMLDIGRRFYTHPGVAIVASSGDYGFTTASIPAVYATTIAVGGTTLTRGAAGGWKEKVWEGAGSGCSAWISKPAWQHDPHCGMRTVADISALADPVTGFAVYDTYGLGPDNGWIVVGGTSLSAPLISGMIGLAGNAPAMSDARRIYASAAGIHDVVGGSNALFMDCGGDYLCTGLPGYDAPSGVGSPRGVRRL